MTINVYVAATFEDGGIAKEICSHLKKHNLMQTENWWEHADPDKWREYGLRDLEAIGEASLLAMYNSGKKSDGKIFEIAWAARSGIPVFTFGNKWESVFRVKIDKHYSTHDPREIAKLIFGESTKIGESLPNLLLDGSELRALEWAAAAEEFIPDRLFTTGLVFITWKDKIKYNQSASALNEFANHYYRRINPESKLNR